MVPESNMPAYPWLAENLVDASSTPVKMDRLRMIGVPYTEDDIATAEAMVTGKTELDALVEYLQVLGTAMQNRRQ